VPRFIHRVAGRGSRELFIISSVALCFGGALGAHYLGLSPALGAFAIGLVVSESDFAHQVIGDTSPLRDTFSALFFVAVGMLINLSFMVENIGNILLVVAALVVGKFLICSTVTRLFRYTGKTVPLVGAGMFQIGEFSLVLAELSRGTGGISEEVYSIILASTLLTIMLTPLIFAATTWVVETPRAISLIGTGDGRQTPIAWAPANHIVICGHGRVGSHLAQALTGLEIPIMIIDLDPGVISELRNRKIHCVYGDSGNPEVLSHARLKDAILLVIATPDPMAAKLTVDNARKINPDIHIMARTHSNVDTEVLRNRGVADLVQPEIEASIELLRHILCRMGTPADEVANIVAKWRNTCPM